jgi:hypothetical protein
MTSAREADQDQNMMQARLMRTQDLSKVGERPYDFETS